MEFITAVRVPDLARYPIKTTKAVHFFTDGLPFLLPSKITERGHTNAYKDTGQSACHTDTA